MTALTIRGALASMTAALALIAWMFSTDDWKKIQNDFRNIHIITYDDLVDGVRGQLYS